MRQPEKCRHDELYASYAYPRCDIVGQIVPLVTFRFQGDEKASIISADFYLFYDIPKIGTISYELLRMKL